LEEFNNTGSTGIGFLDKPLRVKRTAPGADDDDCTVVIKNEEGLHGEHMVGKQKVISVVPEYKLVPEEMVNKSAILYGASMTGKSFLMRYIMSKMRHIYPMVIVFCPSASTNHEYDGIVPDPLIYENFVIDNIRQIYDRQRMAADVYHKANREPVLKRLFERVASQAQLEQATTLRNNGKRQLQGKVEGTPEHKAADELNTRKMVIFYKTIIHRAVATLKKIQDLSDDERHSLHYLWYNPRVMIIFDDCMTEVMAMIKSGTGKNGKKDDTIKNFFFKGRHAFITHFYLFQDDCKLDTDIRKNAFRSIFTSGQVARAFFNRSSNNFTPEERREAEGVISTIFNEKNEMLHYKMVYSRLERPQFYYTVADKPAPFRMCSSVIWEYCSKILREEGKIDDKNPFYRQYMKALEQ
jgi:hypothetical protein